MGIVLIIFELTSLIIIELEHYVSWRIKCRIQILIISLIGDLDLQSTLNTCLTLW